MSRSLPGREELKDIVQSGEQPVKKPRRGEVYGEERAFHDMDASAPPSYRGYGGIIVKTTLNSVLVPPMQMV